ncbi:MAG: 50S ribosomal protein L24 [uncultured bacterium]|nr:MAG: 50S ribosomal protein L24 [uncultured bacterium]OGN55745.1 MAG: 50S ribosomal protein L24 [Chlamydiae bacterium RIFCSPHIGHO2_01_FULL_44_39]OGN58586.1 MAG: 50S ribosomal protein L24 [Chlamydiae bacterium RIFCSPHIGHO2_02_FULL_45_9]OGN60536.1 MAG: 50S ribosomal protein L24 [Chlamydiae bacterium RIFCSPHIGHO2_12_FULL_44_59]OGN65991.1 MAG: 50S ribosomal protein L24 [Chlamydiae bacterium RIFCSPLOWO2_01_FULL_44_52]OGN68806.1 MAG: 50S ribosomal protein L24 [Chlamydiae bacterium RIFCSPLOWO2_02_F
MTKRIKKGEQVLVITGNDRGKIGPVLSRSEDRVIVQGVNVRKKHLKRTQESQGGRVVEMEMPIHISNVALCDKEGNRMKRGSASKQAEVETSKKKAPIQRAAKKVKDV